MRIAQEYIRRAKYLNLTGGPTGLAKQTLCFLCKSLFSFRIYHIFKNNPAFHHQFKEEDMLPKIENINLKLCSSNREAEEMERDGFEFRSCIFKAEAALDKGALAFLIFIGHKFAHVGWIFLNSDSMRAMGHPPLKASFDKSESVTGGVYSIPEYRMTFIATYGMYKRYQYLESLGIQTDYALVETSNTRIAKSSEEVGYKDSGRGYWLRILGFNIWKEKRFP